MASLTGPQKLFVVQQLACFHSLSDVCEQLLEEFGITAETNQIARYKVGCAAAESLGRDLTDAFNMMRKNFLSAEQTIAIMHRNYRARELQWMYERTRKTTPLVAAKMLEQAAKEAGGFFTRPGDSDAPETTNTISEGMHSQAKKIFTPKTSEDATTPAEPSVDPSPIVGQA
jgi:hypothetical protein